jgi:hypothetical protein
MAALSPSLRDWVSDRSRAIVASGNAPDPALIADDARAHLAGQDFSTVDIEALVFIVLMEATKQADADLHETMAQVKAENDKKAKLREAMDAKREADAAAKPSAPVQPQIMLAQPRLQLAKPVSVDTAPIKDQKDSLSDVGEMNSLRLQMLMDRRSKLMEALSNLMKKQSDTASTITQNLK